MILQQVESDAAPLSPDSSVSFEIKTEVTQGDNHVADDNVDDVEDPEHVIGCNRKNLKKIHVSPLTHY